MRLNIIVYVYVLHILYDTIYYKCRPRARTRRSRTHNRRRELRPHCTTAVIILCTCFVPKQCVIYFSSTTLLLCTQVVFFSLIIVYNYYRYLYNIKILLSKTTNCPLLYTDTHTSNMHISYV